jgi:hypothetical protein
MADWTASDHGTSITDGYPSERTFLELIATVCIPEISEYQVCVGPLMVWIV